MAARPSMDARDSSGKKVSLLNDEPNLPLRISSHPPYDYDMARSLSQLSARSSTSSPVTPGLSRADSFDSNIHDPLSPITPTSLLEFGRQSSYKSAGYKDPTQFEYRERMPVYEDYPSKGNYGIPMRPSYIENRTPSYQEPHMFDEEYQHSSETGPKRYPCRYRDSHNCQKTFTTSGHASRHSKIHTAEKGVSCTWEGCQKRFTRADNMKQHLETHTKERSRGTSQKPFGSSPLKALTVPAGVKKAASVPSRPNLSRPSSRNAMAPEVPPCLDPAMFAQQAAPMTAFRTPNGLDTLAFAADQTLRTLA